MNSAEPSIRRLPRLSDIRKSKQTFAAKDINVCYADKPDLEFFYFADAASLCKGVELDAALQHKSRKRSLKLAQ